MGAQRAPVQLVAVDLDGTLLNDEKRLTPGNRAAIDTAIAAGVAVVPCTGRPYSGIPAFLREIPGIAYAVTANGAAVYRLSDGACVYEAPLPDEISHPLLLSLEEMHIMVGYFAGGQGYLDEQNAAILPALHMPAPVEAYVRSAHKIIPDMAEHLRTAPPVQKITIRFRTECEVEERAAALALVRRYPGLNAVSGGEHSLEVSTAAAAKGTMLRRLAELLGAETVLACGDTENDLDMIRKADIGVAMANSEPLLRAEADYITASNNNDGVAKAIYRFVLPAR